MADDTSRVGTLAPWLRDGVRGWILAGTVECARDVVREVGVGAKSAGRAGVIALTLEASGTTARAPSLGMVSTTAGVIPVAAPPSVPGRPPSSASTELVPADVRAYMTQFAARPSWWTALGRDAGWLARGAVATLPLDTVNDVAVVAQRRALVNVNLKAVKGRMWTSELDGFGGSRTLKRTLNVLELVH